VVERLEEPHAGRYRVYSFDTPKGKGYSLDNA
jgi:hypothetical protein